MKSSCMGSNLFFQTYFQVLSFLYSKFLINSPISPFPCLPLCLCLCALTWPLHPSFLTPLLKSPLSFLLMCNIFEKAIPDLPSEKLSLCPLNSTHNVACTSYSTAGWGGVCALFCIGVNQLCVLDIPQVGGREVRGSSRYTWFMLLPQIICS